MLTSQVDNQRVLLRQILQEQFSCNICKNLSLLRLGSMVLIFGITLVVVHWNHAFLSIGVTMVVLGVLVSTISGGLIFYDMCWKSERFSTLLCKVTSKHKVGQNLVPTEAPEPPEANDSQKR